jgi:hypothetical protein
MKKDSFGLVMPDKKFIATKGAHRPLTMDKLQRSFDAVMYPQCRAKLNW